MEIGTFGAPAAEPPKDCAGRTSKSH